MESIKSFFEKFQMIMEEKIVPVASRISSQRHLAALRDGFVYVLGFHRLPLKDI